MTRSPSNSYKPPTPHTADLAEDQQLFYQNKKLYQNELERQHLKVPGQPESNSLLGRDF